MHRLGTIGGCVYCAGILLVLWGLSGPAFAASEPDPFELSPEQLFGATVTSSTRSSGTVWDSPVAIFVLSHDDITRSGATSIPEALRLVPGVHVARSGAGNWAVTVRGFDSGLANKLLVLMDGREVYDGLFSGVYWDVQDTMLEDIDRIEVIRGPGASLWGANAVNGVINIITKSAADTQGNLSSVTTGNQEGIAGERYGGRIGDNGYYRVYGKYVHRAHETTSAGLDAVDDQIARRGGFRTDWEKERDRYTLQGDLYQSGTGQRRNVPLFSGTFTDANREENIDAQGGNILGRWNRQLADDSQFTLQGYLDYAGRDQELVDDNRLSFDLDSVWELAPSDRHAVIVGARYRLSHDQLGETDPAGGLPIIRFDDAVRNDQLISAFAQDKITLDPNRWYLTLGSKFEHNDYTGFELQPTARLQYHPDAQQVWWASVSRAVRTPSRLENDLQAVQGTGVITGIPVSIDTLPNSNLGSEDLVAYELGYRRQLTSEAALDLTAFYNDYSNLIAYNSSSIFFDSNPTRLVFGIAPFNNMKAEIYGTEAVLDWRVAPRLNLLSSYSLLKLAFHEPVGGFTTSTEDSSPQQQFNVRAQWDVRDDLTFDTTLYYVDQLAGLNIDDYLRLDMRLGWQVADGITFNLVGQNLLDDSHPEFSGPTGDPAEISRAFYGQLLWQF